MPGGVIAGGPGDAPGDASLRAMAGTRLCGPSSSSGMKMPGGVVVGNPGDAFGDARPCAIASTWLCGPSSSSLGNEVTRPVGCWVLASRLWGEVLAPVGFPGFSLNT